MNPYLYRSLALCLGTAFGLSAHAQVADLFNPAEPVVSVARPLNPEGGLVPNGVPSCGAEIYSNGPLITSAGTGPGGADLSVLQGSISMTTLGAGHQQTAGNRVADEFVVPAGGWTLGCVVFYAYQTGSATTSTHTAVSLRIWNGVPGAMGSTQVFGDDTTNRMISTTWSNIYRVTETTLTDTSRPIMAQTVNLNGLNLPAGTYWLDWATSGSLASGPWAPPITIAGQATTGNALQFTTTAGAWAALVDGGSTTPLGLPFALLGTSAPVATLSATEIDFGDVGNGQTADGTITLSNTGDSSLNVSALTAPSAPFSLTGGSCAAAPFALAPAASCTLTYRFSPTAVAAANQTLSVSSDGGNPSFALRGNGIAPAAAVLSSSLINFGPVDLSGAATGTITLSNSGGSSLTVSAITSPSAPFAAAGGTCGATPITLAPAASCTLIYRFSPTAPGNFSQTLSVSSTGGNPSFTLQGSGASQRPAVVPSTSLSSLLLLVLATLGLAGWAFARRQ